MFDDFLVVFRWLDCTDRCGTRCKGCGLVDPGYLAHFGFKAIEGGDVIVGVLYRYLVVSSIVTFGK